jgi:hypothetical protein
MRVRIESGISQEGSSLASGNIPTESVDALADQLERRGVGAPAAILLDAHRPLLPLIRQGTIFLGPLLNQLLGPRRAGALHEALENPDAYDRLTARLAAGRPDDRA